MANIRFTGKSVSVKSNVQYDVEIIDITFSGSPTQIELGPNGFDLTYLQQGDERFTPIKGSELALNCLITNDAAGTALLSWINSSINATKEDQYYIHVKVSGNTFWYGVILPDLGTRQDANKPYSYIITATDGLARLKDKEFTYAFTDPRQPFNILIWEILKETPLYLAGNNILFLTSVEWYEDLMPARADYVDPLNHSKIGPRTFLIKGENDDFDGMSYWDVLENICRGWRMRVMLSDGFFRFYQPNVYEDDGFTRYERGYLTSSGLIDTLGTFGYNETLTNNALPCTLDGNQWSFYPALKKVVLKYPFANANMLDTVSFMDQVPEYIYETDLRDNIIGGTNRKLIFTSVLNVSIYDPARLGLLMNVSIAIKIKLGSKYLKKDPFGSVVTWTTNAADRYEFIIEDVQFGNTPINIAFSTPEIPSGTYDANEFSIEVTEIVEMIAPNVLTPNTDYAVTRVTGSTSLKYNTSVTNKNESYDLYEAQNTITPINSYTLELPDVMIGEPIDPSNPGNLFVYNGSIWLASTGLWKVDDTGTASDFNKLSVMEVLSGQTKATRKYQGGIMGANLLPHTSFDYDGYRYILNGGTYSANDETWQGEWFAVSIARADSIGVDHGEIDDGGGATQLRQEIGGVFGRVSDLNQRFDKALFQPFSANATLEPISQVVAASGTKTFTLPHANEANPTGNLSIKISICNVATSGISTLTVNTQDSATIGASGTGTTTVSESNSVTLITDGVNWFII